MTLHDPLEEGAIDDAELWADSWATSVTDQLEKSRRVAWIVASVSAAIAFMLAVALVVLLPLKTVEPYTILVDRQTGNVEALAPLDRQLIGPDAALTRSFLVQYVTAREGFDYNDLQADYRKVALWSAGEARQRYVDAMRAGAPGSPLAVYGTGTRIAVEVTSVSSLTAGRSMVRFATLRTDDGGQAQVAQNWVAVIDYTFSGAEMSEQDRYVNPLGFQVTRYRRDAETLPEDAATPAPVQLRASPAAAVEGAPQ